VYEYGNHSALKPDTIW